jgi:CopG family transcriptional regulator/antitoxin EndoAI
MIFSGHTALHRNNEELPCAIRSMDVEWIYGVYPMAIKVLISLPEKFLENIDLVAEEEHRSRSELIREALRAYLETRQVRKLRLQQVAERSALYGDFAAEFKAWDAASDEALTNFEKGLK